MAVVALILGGVVAGAPATAGHAAPQSTGEPARLFDSRAGHHTVDGLQSGGGRLAPGSVTRVFVSDRAGLPSTNTENPLNVMLNVTAVDPSAAGFLKVTACDTSTSAVVSSVNFLAGQTIANSVIRSTADGDVCVFASTSTHLVVDLVVEVEWRFAGNANQRVVDTRSGLGGSTLDPGVGFLVRFPRFADLMVVNLTAVNAAGAGWLAFRPCDSPFSAEYSMLNVAGSAPVANLVIVPIDWCLFSTVRTDVVIDLLGGLPLFVFCCDGVPGPDPVRPGPYEFPPPRRIVDTRLGDGGRLGPRSTRLLVAPQDNVPKTEFLNVTVVDPERDGYLLVFACSSETDAVPGVSTLNFRPHDVIGHLTAINRRPGQGICVHSSSSTDIVIDTSAVSIE